jgi:hypothetical protein
MSPTGTLAVLAQRLGKVWASRTAQQLREAFPWDEAPRYLTHDRDHAFDRLGATAMAMGIEEVLTAPRPERPSPGKGADVSGRHNYHRLAA